MTEILVTGATGTVGSAVVDALLARDAKVRVGVRTPAKAEAVAAQGARVVKLDYDAPETLEAAFAGVERAFLLVPFVEDFDALVPRVLSVAKAAGVQHVVKMSAAGADAEAPMALARKHGLADGAVAQSGMGYTILKPTFFQDNLVKFQGQAIAGQGAFYGASAGAKVAYVSSADIARTAATILEKAATKTDLQFPPNSDRFPTCRSPTGSC